MAGIRIAQEIYDLIYPVGSIYISVNSTNPSNYFGGTWVAWGSGRVPVGVDTTKTEFDTVEETGGEIKHTLTIKELPSYVYHSNTAEQVGGVKTSFSSGTVYGINTQSTNFGQAHNNLQPYITCFMWKRTA